jgi:glycosyltransferase involved in cell wall biosynthesis
MPRLSCFIITRDEGDRIERCIRSIQPVVDEVVVVDSGSTDDTVAKAEALGAKVLFRAWDGYGPQKRFAEEHVSADWVLNLDADEVATPELREELRRLMQDEPPFPAYRLRLVTVYPGRDRPRLWADDHNAVRLYDRRLIRYRDSLVHDRPETGDFPVGQLQAPALHFSARSLAHMRAKYESYTDLQAKALKKPRWQLVVRLPFEYPLAFLRSYLARRNFTGGWDGLQVAHIFAFMRAKRIWKMLHRREPDRL